MTDRCAQKIMREYFLKLNCETLQVLLAYYFRALCGMLGIQKQPFLRSPILLYSSHFVCR